MCRHSAQTCCPWNEKFAQELKESAFARREVIAGKDATTLAEDLLAMEQAEFSAAFRKSQSWPLRRIMPHVGAPRSLALTTKVRSRGWGVHAP